MKIANVRVNSWTDSGYIPRAIRRKVIARDGHKCVFCGKSGIVSLCHIRPKCRGGKTTVNNLTVCNIYSAITLYLKYVKNPYWKEKTFLKE